MAEFRFPPGALFEENTHTIAIKKKTNTLWRGGDEWIEEGHKHFGFSPDL